MSLQKGFLRKQTVTIDGWLLFSGVLLSSAMSFCFHSFFIFISENVRGALIEFTSSMLLMSASDIKFYSYVSALMASVIGQGFGLQLLLQSLTRNSNFKTRLNVRTQLNHLRFTHWSWLFWFAKWFSTMSFLYAALALQYALDIRAELGYFFFLFSLVWFLNYWLGAYKIFRKSFLVWIGGAFLYLILSTLILGNIRLVDYELTNDIMQKQYPEIEHDITLPESLTRYRRYRRYNDQQLYLFLEDGQTYVVFEDSREKKYPLNSNELSSALGARISELPEVERFNTACVISSDIDVPFSDIQLLEETLVSQEVNRVIYRTVPKNSKLPWHYPAFQTTGITKYISNYCKKEKEGIDSLRSLGYKAEQIKWPDTYCYAIASYLRGNRVMVKSTDAGLFLNDQKMDADRLLQTLTILIQKYPKQLAVFYKPDEPISYGHYLSGKDLIMQAYVKNRRRYALEKYELDYELYHRSRYPYYLREEYKSIDSTYAMNFVELSGWNLEFYNYLKGQE